MPTSLLVHLCGRFDLPRPPPYRPLFPSLPSSLFSLPLCTLGVFQFVPAIRKKVIWLHRWNGRAYTACHTLSGVGILMMMNQYREKGDGTTFWAIFALFIGTQGSLAMAIFYLISMKRIELHRQWMLRNYAWNTSIITIRFILVPVLLSQTFSTQETLVAQHCDVMEAEYDPGITNDLLGSESLVFNYCNQSGLAYFSPGPGMLIGEEEPNGPNPAAVQLSFGTLAWLAWGVHAFAMEVWITRQYLVQKHTIVANKPGSAVAELPQVKSLLVSPDDTLDLAALDGTQRTWLQCGLDPFFSHPGRLLDGLSSVDKWLFVLHLCVGLAGLLCTQHFNRAHDAERDGNYFSALFASGASTSFTLDVLILSVSFLVWLGRDAYALGFSVFSIAIVFLSSFLLAVSYAGPVYLAFRIVRVAKADASTATFSGGWLNALPWAAFLGLGFAAMLFV